MLSVSPCDAETETWEWLKAALDWTLENTDLPRVWSNPGTGFLEKCSIPQPDSVQKAFALNNLLYFGQP